MRPFWAVVAVAVVLNVSEVAAQGGPANPYRPNAADEDWTFLKTSPRTDAWDPIKYIPLGREDWSLTLSGELRLRAEGFRVRESALRPQTVDNYLLQRYLVGSDLRLGRRVRAFAEIQSGLIDGKVQSPRPTDRNPFDVHQGFVELRQGVRQNDLLAIVAGRQELEIGSSRLISASPGLNVKRSFDGVAVAYRSPSWRFSAAAASLIALKSGAFDDRADFDQMFWGLTALRLKEGFQREVGAYYLGIDRSLSQYAQASGSEVRHTMGLKWTGGNARVDLNYDAVFQAGRFSGAAIWAWAFATETGFRPAMPWRPRLSVRVDVASGDRDAANPTLQSFNPLFPGNAYSGAIGLLGPTNLTDLTPGLTIIPRPGLTVGIEAPSYWRTSMNDGVYATDLRLLLRPEVGAGAYVGTNPGALVVWQATRHLQLQGVITRFLPGKFLEDSFIAEGFGFYSFTTRYRF